MDVTTVLLVWGALLALLALALEIGNYRHEIEATRPDAWAVMMHERIWDENRDGTGPP